MQTANLSGALLDYHTARAEGVPAADLEFRAAGSLCVRVLRNGPAGIDGVMVLDYSTNWALTGPLVEKHDLTIYRWMYDTADRQFDSSVADFWAVEAPSSAHYIDCYRSDFEDEAAPTPLIAICRAVVRAAFGDEVEDLP